MRRDPDEVQSTAPVKQGLQKPPEEEPDCEKRKDRKRMVSVAALPDTRMVEPGGMVRQGLMAVGWRQLLAWRLGEG